MSRVLGIGVDVVQLARVHALLQRKSPMRLATLLLHPEERVAFRERFEGGFVSTLGHPHSLDDRFVPRPGHLQGPPPADPWRARVVEYLGGRFAVKEAAFKAASAGTGIRLRWHQVRILAPPAPVRGPLTVHVAGVPAVEGALVSLAHDGGVCVAQVLLLGR